MKVKVFCWWIEEMMGKTRTLYLIMYGVFILVFLVLYESIPSSAATVWSDDFDDGNLDDWTIIQGNFSVDNGLLHATEDWNRIDHTSSVSYGTWSFDLYLNSGTTPEGHSLCRILFISGDPDPEFNHTTNYYDLTLFRNHYSLSMYNWTLAWAPLRLDYYYPPEDYSGWWHIDITRGMDGQFNVFLNGSRIMEAQNDRYTISSLFCFYTHEGCLLDNIVVSDTIDVFPQWYESIPWSYITPFIVGITTGIIVLIIRRANLEERTMKKLTLGFSILLSIGGCYWFFSFMWLSIEYANPGSAILAIFPGGVIAIVFGYVAYFTWRKMKSDYQNPS